MEKIDVDKLFLEKSIAFFKDKAYSESTGVSHSVQILAEKINEIVEWINDHDLSNFIGTQKLTPKEVDTILLENYRGPEKEPPPSIEEVG